MKTQRPLISILCLAVLAGLSPLSAAKAKKKADGADGKVPASKYDADNNGLLDSTEKQALAKAFKDGSDPAIRIYDLNQDGELALDEISQISLLSDTAGTAPAAAPKKEKKRKPSQSKPPQEPQS